MSLIWLVFCGVVAYYASEKNRSPVAWGLLALVISPLLAGVALAMMKDLSVKEEINRLDKKTDNIKREVKSNQRYNEQQRGKMYERLESGNQGNNQQQQLNSSSNQQALEAKKVKCNSCGEYAPADSSFCVNCGEKIIPDGKQECSNCQELIAEDAKFCPECGAELIVRCPSCGQEVTEDTKYCMECGTKIDAEEEEIGDDVTAEVETIGT